MLRIFYAVVSLLFAGLGLAQARTFTVVVYNVENLFDADGVALYDDYKPDNAEMPSPYSPRKTLTKIQNIAKVLQRFNDGAGPEIILFQEFELDRTPESTVTDYAAFLKQYADTTVDVMLTTGFNETIAGLPVDALALKYFTDNGMGGYHVAVPEARQPLEQATAHNNVVFTKFPVTYQKSHHTDNARTIQEVGIDVDGNELIVFNNHWKSGASNPGTEKQRVKNARDLRTAVEAVIVKNPQADILIGGDLNTYYNAAQHFPASDDRDRWSNTRDYAIEVLGSQGDELATKMGKKTFYNLWFEVTPDKRGSELYRGNWGTLMMFLVTPGLYDSEGVTYVDNSFRVIKVPGLNAVGPWNQPKNWHFTGEAGGGFSDHFPIAVTLTTDPVKMGMYVSSTDADGPATVPSVDYGAVRITALPELTALPDQEPATLVENMGEVFAVQGTLVFTQPFIVRVGEQHYEIYAYDDSIREQLNRLPANEEIRFIGQLDEHRGKSQFVIHHADWLR